MTPFFVRIPIRLISEANAREHWAVRNKRKKAQQQAVRLAFLSSQFRVCAPPVDVALTRIGIRKLDPDNLAGSFKATQDEIARLLGVDDGDERAVRWTYGQRCEGTYALEVAIEPRRAA